MIFSPCRYSCMGSLLHLWRKNNTILCTWWLQLIVYEQPRKGEWIAIWCLSERDFSIRVVSVGEFDIHSIANVKIYGILRSEQVHNKVRGVFEKNFTTANLQIFGLLKEYRRVPWKSIRHSRHWDSCVADLWWLWHVFKNLWLLNETFSKYW